MKAYTDTEQSKKLAEILPLESADACWTNHLFGSILSSWRIESTPPQEYKALLDRFIVRGYLIEPCWSLAALVSVLPDDCSIDKEDGKYVASYIISDECGSYTEDNPIDACVAMIEYLHKINLL